MDVQQFSPGSLVLYKQRPAIVLSLQKKVTILDPAGERISVRPKDLALLHPGPLESLSDLHDERADLPTAWEILEEEMGVEGRLNLKELSQFIFARFTPSTAWATWKLVADGLYFSGIPETIVVHQAEQVAQERARREARAAEAAAWDEFLSRAGELTFSQADAKFLRELEELAYGLRNDSRALNALGKAERPEVAQAFLVEIGYWDPSHNPHPRRAGVSLEPPEGEAGAVSMEPRHDLTHLQAYAIDDQGAQDPDDALSIEGDRIWIHIADVSDLVKPGSAPDQEARGRGATLYLPDQVIPMLPRPFIVELGLGLKEVSPAMSLALTVSERGEILEIHIVPSLVRVTRLTYAQVDDRLKEEPFQTLEKRTQAFFTRRMRNGAIPFDFPEVKLRVEKDRVIVKPILPLRSRSLVREAMLMAGEAAARYALENQLPFPFTTQESFQTSGEVEPGRPDEGDLAGQFSFRRKIPPSQVRATAGPHAGVGLPVYSRVTSPLRRYADLLAHQQLRAHLSGRDLLEEREIIERLAAGEAAGAQVRRAEFNSNLHWTLVYLRQNPGWEGEGVLVALRGAHGRLILPELALETSLQLDPALGLNTVVRLKLKSVSLPALEAYFEVVGNP